MDPIRAALHLSDRQKQVAAMPLTLPGGIIWE